MVCNPPAAGADVSNRGIVRGRLFLGYVLLFGAVIAWAVSLMMSPHGAATGSDSASIRNSVVTFMRNSAIGTLLLSALAGWLLFPLRRPQMPRRDWAVLIALGIMVATSLYQLWWLRSLTY
jgi:drug/metabolite transporter (DMT)-like permease